MADYRELLRRALDALPDNNGKARRGVYEKARTALINHLRAMDPPLSAREITQHRLTLEDSIRQVERDATEVLLRGLRNDEAEDTASVTPEPTPGSGNKYGSDRQTEAMDPVEPDDTIPALARELRAVERRAKKSGKATSAGSKKDGGSTVSHPVGGQEKNSTATSHTGVPGVINTGSDAGAMESVPAVSIGAEAVRPLTGKSGDLLASYSPAQTKNNDGDAATPLHREPGSGSQTLPKGLHQVIAEARAASPDGDRAAPDVAAQPSEIDVEDGTVQPALSRVVEVETPEPDPLADQDEPPQETINRAIKALELEAGSSVDPGTGHSSDEVTFGPDVNDATIVDAGDEIVEDVQVGSNGLSVFLTIAMLLLGGATGGVYWAWKEGFVDLDPVVSQWGFSGTPAETDESRPSTAEPDVPAQANVRDVPAKPDRSDSGERLTPDPAGDAGLSESAASKATQPRLLESDDSMAEATENEKRLKPEEPSAVTEDPVLNTADTSKRVVQVGARSMLLEESVDGTGGAVPFTGEINWSRDVDEIGVPVIKAAVSIPARNLSVDLLIRKNNDATLPASHLIEVNFSVTQSFVGGGVASMPGIYLTDQELGRGMELTGASARIFDNSFLYALGASEADLERNLALLTGQGWIGIAVVYATGRSARITLEKGEEGQAIFDSVLEAWSWG